MRRFILSVAVALIACSWASPAWAQRGFGSTPDPSSEIEAARSKGKQNLKKYSRRSASNVRTKLGGSFLDPYGRRDLAGHIAPGYPSARGDSSSSAALRGSVTGGGKATRRPSPKPRPNANVPKENGDNG